MHKNIPNAGHRETQRGHATVGEYSGAHVPVQAVVAPRANRVVCEQESGQR